MQLWIHIPSAHICPIFLPTSAIFFYFLSVILIVMKIQFETQCFYIDLEISSKIKLIYVPPHYFWSIPFSAVNSVLISTFPHVCQIYVTEVLFIHFCNYYHLKILPVYEFQNEVNFGWSQIQIHIQFQMHIWIVTF